LQDGALVVRRPFLAAPDRDENEGLFFDIDFNGQIVLFDQPDIFFLVANDVFPVFIDIDDPFPAERLEGGDNRLLELPTLGLQKPVKTLQIFVYDVPELFIHQAEGFLVSLLFFFPLLKDL
jgi:hypothetical protein